MVDTTARTRASRPEPARTDPNRSPTRFERTPAPRLDAVRSGQAAMREGDSGPAVRDVQRRLNDAGARPPLDVDGDFGPLTRGAVERFQRENPGLAVDGVIGLRTLARLEGTAAAEADALERTSPRRSVSGSERALPSAERGATNPTLTRPPTRGLSREGPALPAEVQRLSEPTRARLTQALAGAHGDATRTAVEGLLRHPRLGTLDAESRAQLLGTLDAPAPVASGGLGGLLGNRAGPAGDDAAVAALRTRAQQARELLDTTAMRAPARERARLVDVYAAANSTGRGALIELGGQGNRLNRLTAPDARGTRMLDSFHALATRPLANGADRGQLLNSTLDEVANPERIEQWRQGTCAGASVSIVLARTRPAEYARIVSGLAAPGGTVLTASGETLRRNPGSLNDTRSMRSQSERLIQDSFLDFANGSLAYDVGADRHTYGDRDLGAGLNPGESARLARAVLGEPGLSPRTRWGRVTPRDASIWQRGMDNLRNNLQRMTFGIDPNSPMAVLQSRQNQLTLVGMTWGGPEARGGHAVVVERIEGGRVYFQNPHGNRHHGQAPGTTLNDPPRRVEFGSTQSMSLADFRARLNSVIA